MTGFRRILLKLLVLLILQEILQAHFLFSRNLEMKGCQGYGVKQIKFSVADKRNSGTRFGEFLLTQVVLISSIKLISSSIS